MLEGITNNINSAVDYIKSGIEYIRTTLETVKTAILVTKDVIATIGDAIATIGQILGFIGFRVFILLVLTGFIAWLLNLCSPTTKRTNYFLSVGAVIWVALNAKMPIHLVVFKYMLIIASPMLITQAVAYLLRVSKIVYRLTDKKMTSIIAKANLLPRRLTIPKDPNIAVLFSGDLPSKEQYANIKATIMENEKIQLTDGEGRLIFSNENKISQFVRSCEDKKTDIMWFWSGDYGAEEIAKELSKIPKIRQTKHIVGSGDNSFILNFLQDKWGWKVIYSNNYIRKIETLTNTPYMLKLINDFELENGWVLKRKVIASDLSVLAISPIAFDKQVLLIGGETENDASLYRSLLQLKKNIVESKQHPSAIIINNINVNHMTTIIGSFHHWLKNQAIFLPIFYADDVDFVISNDTYLIEYKEDTGIKMEYKESSFPLLKKD